jgi:hypothetical protein
MTAPQVQRQRLPNRRSHEIVQFEQGAFTYIAGIGRFDDGRLAEVFLTASKTGTAVEAASRDAAIVASLALQRASAGLSAAASDAACTAASAREPLAVKRMEISNRGTGRSCSHWRWPLGLKDCLL